MTKPNSLFADMVKALTQNQQDKIVDLAKEKYLEHLKQGSDEE